MPEQKKTLLIVEDDPGLQSQLRWHFDQYEVVIAGDREAAIDELRMHEPAVVLQDLGLPPDDEGVEEGFKTLDETLRLAPYTKVVVVTGNHDYANAVRAVSLGAYDFYEKPVNTEVLDLIVQRAFQMHDLEQQNRLLQQQSSTALDGIIASSPIMMQLCRMVEKIAPTEITCLLLGESGTGKEVFARALHNLSNAKSGRFVAINCAAVPENLMESELFGYEKGAFTGAAKRTLGKVEHAAEGTLFLDEIGDMPLALQAKLLRFLQERVIERVGGREEIPVDVRVLCATNKNLEKMVAEGSFREDLYYRISEMVLEIPPLRERPGDQVLLAQHLVTRFNAELKGKVKGLSSDAVTAIESYAWPGNIRELENKVKRAVIMTDENKISATDLGLSAEGEVTLNLRQVRRDAEVSAIRNAMASTAGNVSAAAKLLGITRPTLYDLGKKYEITELVSSVD